MPIPLFSRTKGEIDPVCGMKVDPKKAANTYDHNGKTYYFCAPGCRAAFSKEPEKYLREGPKGM